MLSNFLIIIAVFFMVLGVFYLSGIICNLLFVKGTNKKCYILIAENNIEEMWADVNYINRKIKNSKILVLCKNVNNNEHFEYSDYNNIIYASKNTLIEVLMKEKQLCEDDNELLKRKITKD